MRQDVQQVIEERYDASRRYHTNKGVQFELTFEEFAALWNPYRKAKIRRFLDSGHQAKMRKWFRHPKDGPVCTWLNKEVRAGNSLNASTAQITTRDKSRWIFRIQAGEQHKPESIVKMRKPKTERHKANMRKPKSAAQRDKMAQAALERWARVRANKEQSK